MNAAVIGASDKPERYSCRAVKLLPGKGHTVFPIHQRIKNNDLLLTPRRIIFNPGAENPELEAKAKA